MIISLNKYISSLCPVCNEPVVSEITPFALNGDFEICCNTCKSKYLKIRKSTQKKYAIELNCFICDDTHKFDISFGGIWGKKITALACPAGGIDTIYIGDKAEVETASELLMERLKSLSQSSPEEIYENADPIIHRAVEELNLKLSHGKILCMCGKCSLIVRVSPYGITLTCNNCNASEFIPLKTNDDLDSFKARDTVLLL